MKHRGQLVPFKQLCWQQSISLAVQPEVIREPLARRNDHPTADDILTEVRPRLEDYSAQFRKFCHPCA